jgi:hypothetical protein
MKPVISKASPSHMSLRLTIGALVLASLLLPSTAFTQQNPPAGNPHQPGGVVRAQSESLRQRLLQLNHDISTKGLHVYPQSREKLLTGYAYGEFFDWDLYFENMALGKKVEKCAFYAAF